MEGKLEQTCAKAKEYVDKNKSNILKKSFKEYLNIPKANFSSTYSDIFIGLIASANGAIKRNNLIGDIKKSNTPHYAEDIDLLLRSRTISFRGFVKKYCSFCK